jgi:hypothetical protein
MGAEFSRKKGRFFFSDIRCHFGSNNLPYFTFYPTFRKPIKTKIRHLLFTTLAQDISDGFMDLVFDVISVKLMSANLSSPAEGTFTVNLPLFLITGPRSSKSRGTFQLISLCHIAIVVEA